jgi:LacI family transcriptional regulator
VGASDAGWDVSFHGALKRTDRWRAFMKCLRDTSVDGVLFVSITRRQLLEEALEVWKGPSVLLDHYYPDLPVTGVIDDSEGGARLGTEHLLELGHRRIGYLDDIYEGANPWRYAGYAGALRAAGIEPDDALRVPCHAGMQDGRAAAEQLLDLPQPPTAILAFNDVRGVGAWEAAEARGLRVGKDFAIVGYGDCPPGGATRSITTLRIDPPQMGEAAVRELGRLMGGEGTPGELVTLPAELIVRDSSRDARLASA